MRELGEWGDASAIILSCPGPLRRHGAAILPMDGLALPQVLLGAESQLMAFAAFAGREAVNAGRMFFAPLPEVFAANHGLAAALAQAGAATGAATRAVHLRFGGVRAARVLKGARNAAMLAERGGPPPLTASHHPFAGGQMLPAAIQHIFALGRGTARPCAMGDAAALPVLELPPALMTADLPPAADPSRNAPGSRREAAAPAGLELACLATFDTAGWAAGGTQVPYPPTDEPTVLLPWNLDHPGGIVPELLCRLARLAETGATVPRIVMLPFNYIGQTGTVRALIDRLGEASERHRAMLPQVFLARAGSAAAIATLLALSRVAWVDGNDPEHWWTMGRLAACGVANILVDPEPAAPAEPCAWARLAADDALWVEADTRCGTMIFPARLPSLRALPRLLRMTQALQSAQILSAAAPEPARRRRRLAGQAA